MILSRRSRDRTASRRSRRSRSWWRSRSGPGSRSGGPPRPPAAPQRLCRRPSRLPPRIRRRLGFRCGRRPAAGPSAAPAPSSPLDGLPTDGSLLGSKDAKVLLTYWADFQCPYCDRFATDVLPLLASRIADGTVAVQHRDFVFIGPESIDAAVAVRCAGEQGKYWPMHDAVYAAQAGENQGAFARPRLAQIAASIGLDATSLTACLDRQDLLAAVMADTSAGVRAGVTSTPTIDLPGHRYPRASPTPRPSSRRSTLRPPPAPRRRPPRPPRRRAIRGRARRPAAAWRAPRPRR